MSNQTVSVAIKITFPGEPAVQVNQSCQFQAKEVSILDVPDTAPAGDWPIPFGSIDKATLVAVRNRTGQKLALSLNGAEAPTAVIPIGGFQLFSAEGLTDDDSITSATVTTAAEQTGAGTIEAWVCGDPVA